MKTNLFLPVTVALALTLTGCGTAASLPTAGDRPTTALAAQAAVEDGQIRFDKQIVYSTVDVLGIGKVYAEKLAAVGIKNVNALLVAAGKRSERAKLAKATGISEKLILTWVNHGDLMRVTGAGPEYARLLERAGVDTVPELAKRRAENLAASLVKANDLGGGKVAVKRMPGQATTTQWIGNAQNFARMVTY
jgi:predicted flap endonuclease-1-like 5' DNA nuclease